MDNKSLIEIPRCRLFLSGISRRFYFLGVVAGANRPCVYSPTSVAMHRVATYASTISYHYFTQLVAKGCFNMAISGTMLGALYDEVTPRSELTKDMLI